MNILKTGGSSYVSNEVDKAIYNIIGLQIDGLKNNYDDDQDNSLNCSSNCTENK